MSGKSFTSSKLLFGMIVVIGLLSFLCTVYQDFVIVLLPKYVDAYFMRALYPRNRKNDGMTTIPILGKLVPTPNAPNIIEQCLNTVNGHPILVKNFVGKNKTDQEDILRKLEKANEGKKIRLLDFEGWTIPHFSPSCSRAQDRQVGSTNMDFSDYARSFMIGDSSKNHTYLYAGFESITSVEEVTALTGVDWSELDYRQNNLFISNFPKDVVAAPLHGAPIDSFSIQLLGSKTWYFVSPEELASIPNIPMPTCFNLPMTDDELLSKIKNLLVVKQEPGDLLYFGPHWSHVVATSAGPNLMFNVRVNAFDKIFKGPKSLAAKLTIRRLTRPTVGRPQDNKDVYPMLYRDINSYYDECGSSEAFTSIINRINHDGF